MNNGGFVILDLSSAGNVVIGALSTFPTVKGAYDIIESAVNPVMICRLTTTDGEETPTITEYKNFFGVPETVSGDFVFTIPTKTGFIYLTVTDDDEIKVDTTTVTGALIIDDTTLEINADGELAVKGE